MAKKNKSVISSGTPKELAKELKRYNDHLATAYVPITDYTLESLKDNKEYQEFTKAIDDGKEVTVAENSVITIPFASNFIVALKDTLTYLFTTVSTEELIYTMNKVKTNFKDVPEEEITPADKAIWTLMSITNEVNNQAALQGKVVIQDALVKDNINDILSKMNDQDIELSETEMEAIFKRYKSEDPRTAAEINEVKFKEDSEEDYIGDGEKKTSSED
jgi:hypothetical protein